MPLLRFGIFEVDPDSGELRKRGVRMRLRDSRCACCWRWPTMPAGWSRANSFDITCGRTGRSSISIARSTRRSASCEACSETPRRSPRFVETLSKRGYRFIGAVERWPARRRRAGPASVSEAQLAYVTGRYLWNRRTITDLHASIRYFERALEIDPEHTLAHVGLADAHLLLGIWGIEPPDTAFGAARRAAARALERDAETGRGAYLDRGSADRLRVGLASGGVALPARARR